MNQFNFRSLFFVFGLVFVGFFSSCEKEDSTTFFDEQKAIAEFIATNDTLQINNELELANNSVDSSYQELRKTIYSLPNRAYTGLMCRAATEQVYDILVVSDLEIHMRGISEKDLKTMFAKMVGIGTTYNGLKYDDGTIIGKPELALAAGDLTITLATEISWDALESLAKVFKKNDIHFFPISGNHDFDQVRLSQDVKIYGYSLIGHYANVRTNKSVINMYNTALSFSTENFSNIDEPKYVSHSSMTWIPFKLNLQTAPAVYGFTYKGVDYVMESSFLYIPKAKVNTKSFFGLGPATFTEGLGADYLKDRANRVSVPQRIFVQHFPYNAIDRWWSDWWSEKSAATLRSNYVNALKAANVSAVFTGHNHEYSITDMGGINDYNCGYTGGKGEFYMVRVSSTNGVTHVKALNTSDLK